MKNHSASPSVRAKALELSIDLEKLAADLDKRQITLDDLSPKQNTGRSQVADSLSYWDVDHSLYGDVQIQATSKIDRVASDNLSAANTVIPQVTHQDHADITAIEALRGQFKLEAKKRGVKLTGLAFYVKALAHTLKKFQKFNASLSSDGQTLFLKEYVHIGIAVDTEHGLMVPVIRNVDKKGLFTIAAEIIELANKAKSRKLSADDMGGASMTISNLGGIGGTGFTPIVNPPEVAILGITRTETRPFWDGEAFVPTKFAPLDLSYDHRVINGADAARFLAELTHVLKDPRQLLV